MTTRQRPSKQSRSAKRVVQNDQLAVDGLYRRSYSEHPPIEFRALLAAQQRPYDDDDGPVGCG